MKGHTFPDDLGLQAEGAGYVAAHADQRDEAGRRLVVRNGSHQERQVLTLAGAVRVRAPRVNGKRVDDTSGERARFSSAILPAWSRKSPRLAEVLPLLHLHGLSTSDFTPALEQFLAEHWVHLRTTRRRSIGRGRDRHGRVNAAPIGTIHHVELWVPDLVTSVKAWEWLLNALGYSEFQDWPNGRSWRLGETYLVIEQSPALTAPDHDRCRPGLNHIAFHAGDRAHVDHLVERASGHGWTLMFPDQHPWAGGSDHYAAYLTKEDGYEIELVATNT